ncbi:RICIN domain-containing protein [Streptomyces sp. V4I8]|uniref:RICIN domain-containing protein n=1 Tax=Streptomyces sp. V4I8 TaxID=3156469 RepID=UPI0035163A76
MQRLRCGPHVLIRDVKWTIDTAPGGAYTLTYVSSGKALDVDGYKSTVGLQLQQWKPTGGTNQRWYLRPNDDGYFSIVR